MSKKSEKSDRTLRAIERERREMQREQRDELVRELRQLQSGEVGQFTIGTVSPSSRPIPAAVTGASVQELQPVRPIVSPANTANAKDRIGPKVDPVFDGSSKGAQLTVDNMTLQHLADTATHTGTAINPMNIPPAGAPTYMGTGLNYGPGHLKGTSTPKGDGIPPMSGDGDASKHDSSVREKQDKVDKPGSVVRDAHSNVNEVNTIAHSEASGLDTSFSDTGDDLEQDGSIQSVSDEEDKLSFAGNMSVKSSDEKDVKEEEQKTMKMLQELLTQTRALSTEDRENRKTSEKVYKTVDIDLEQKATIEKIRSLKHEAKLMSERRAQKEKEMLEAEERLRQLKEKGSRFEEALRERERRHKEEQIKLERLKFIKDEERKLVEALMQKEEEEKFFDERIKRLQQEEQNVLSYIENRQIEFNKQTSTVVKTEPNQERRPQVGTIRGREEPRQQLPIETERNITRNSRHEIYSNREREIMQHIDIKTERNRFRDTGEHREYVPERNRKYSSEHSSIESDAQSSRREELDKREAYLKKLEADLLRKEEEIRAKISHAPVNQETLVKTVEPAVETQGATGSDKPGLSSSARPEFTYFNKPYVSPFSGVEPTPKNESTFEAWKLEIESLKSMLPEHMVIQSIRNSLKVPARNSLLTLGPRASSEEILCKLNNAFGNVASGQSIMQEFYTAVQQPDENVTMWSLRLEEILQRIAEKSSISAEQKIDMLRERFW